jgi:hypothetical protein
MALIESSRIRLTAKTGAAYLKRNVAAKIWVCLKLEEFKIKQYR